MKSPPPRLTTLCSSLYIAPIESDTKGLPPPPVFAAARSSIRRLRHRGSDAARENRRRALYAAAAYQAADGAEPWPRPSRSTSHEPRAALPTGIPGNPGADAGGAGSSAPYLRGLQLAIDLERRQAAHLSASTDLLRAFHEGPNDLHRRNATERGASALETFDTTPGDLLRIANDAYNGRTPTPLSLPTAPTIPEQWDPEGSVPRRTPALQAEVYPLSPTRRRRDPPAAPSFIVLTANSQTEPSTRRFPPSPPPPRHRQYARRGGGRSDGRRLWAWGVRNADGLGDRRRSTSPENDWDTLLSTIPPDPQPPSIGSSFASESASAVASQSAGAGSSGTSLTGPDTTEDLGTIVISTDLPCESGCENSDTEGDDDDDDDDETERNALPRFPPALRQVTSYATVVARGALPSANEDSLEYWGGIGGLRRIVRSLARREDIPDEWWAEVGLSRNLA